jgi:hypothetical protein
VRRGDDGDRRRGPHGAHPGGTLTRPAGVRRSSCSGRGAGNRRTGASGR